MPTEMKAHSMLVQRFGIKRTFARTLTGIGVALLLLAIFVAYLRPSFMLELANRFYLC